MLIVDSREPKTAVDYFASRNVKYEIQALNYGDYLILGRKNFVIERKDIFDFFNSLDDGRLWNQLSGIEKYADYRRLLLVEGNLSKVMAVRKSVNYARFVGALTKVISGWDVSIYMTNSFSNSMYFIERLNYTMDKGINESYKIANIDKIGRKVEQEVIDILGAISGIGDKKAVDGLKAFGSIKNVFKAKKEKLVEVFGKSGEHLFDVMNYKYKEQSEVKKDEQKPDS